MRCLLLTSHDFFLLEFIKGIKILSKRYNCTQTFIRDCDFLTLHKLFTPFYNSFITFIFISMSKQKQWCQNENRDNSYYVNNDN